MSAGTGPDDPAHDRGIERPRDADASTEHDSATGGNDEGGYEADPMFWAVRPEQVPVLVHAYREAVRQADQLAVALAVVGLDASEVVAVTAAVGLDGAPLVHGVLTLAGARRLADYLAAGGRPPPGLPISSRPPDWAA